MIDDSLMKRRRERESLPSALISTSAGLAKTASDCTLSAPPTLPVRPYPRPFRRERELTSFSPSSTSPPPATQLGTHSTRP